MSGPAGGVRVALTIDLPDGPTPLVVDWSPDGVKIDGEPTAARLDRRDAAHGVLRRRGILVAATPEPGKPDTHNVLILASEPDGRRVASGVARREVIIDGWRIEVTVEPEARAALRERARRGRAEAGSSGPTEVHAIIPGVVVSVSVAPGDAVTAGQQLLVVEAMKMQNELRAPRDGTIEQVAVGTGSTIEVGDLLLVLA